MVRAWLAVLALIGCNGDRMTDGDSGGPPVPTVDTGDDSQYFPADSIYVSAELPFDGTRQVTADVQGNSAPPLVLITLATSEWDSTGGDVENYCVIGIPLLQAVPRDVGNDSRLWFGVSWVPSLDPVLSTCDTPGFELNPRRWGSDPVFQFTEGVDYFVAVGEMTPYVAQSVKAQAPELDLIGGAIGLPSFFVIDGVEGVVNHVYTFAFEMDEAGRLEVDNGAFVEIPSKSFQADPRQSAYYSLTSLYYWQVP